MCALERECVYMSVHCEDPFDSQTRGVRILRPCILTHLLTAIKRLRLGLGLRLELD